LLKNCFYYFFSNFPLHSPLQSSSERAAL